ncbi:hypothetical protein FQN50_009339 [Emmonsiellopsis sp. PD_5]|nr:hypothetical protein FQN50_009339 [Emmonsiellopsis sp. PD_5]
MDEVSLKNPIEFETKERGGWVTPTITQFVEKVQKDDPAAKLFNNDAWEEDIKKVKEFFVAINKKIEEKNKEEGYSGPDLEIRKVKYSEYLRLLTDWGKTVAEEQDSDTVWDRFDETHANLAKLNEENHLPEGWNIDRDWVDNKFGKQAADNEGSDDASGGFDIQSLKVECRPDFYRRKEGVRVLFWENSGKSVSMIYQAASKRESIYSKAQERAFCFPPRGGVAQRSTPSSSRSHSKTNSASEENKRLRKQLQKMERQMQQLQREMGNESDPSENDEY